MSLFLGTKWQYKNMIDEQNLPDVIVLAVFSPMLIRCCALLVFFIVHLQFTKILN